MVVIDDAQWLDESSLGAILFAARRLLADAMALLVASRSGPEFGLPELGLEGLDRATASALLERHAGRPLPPGAADRAFEATLGNPLALVELAGSAAGLPLEPDVPVQTSVEQAFAARVRALPEPTRRLLALAAAEEVGDLGVLERAANVAAGAGEPAAHEPAARDEAPAHESAAPGELAAQPAAAGEPAAHEPAARGQAPAHETAAPGELAAQPAAAGEPLAPLAAAEQAGLVTLALDRLTFCHPLARSAAYRCAAPSERRAAHAVLARVEPDADRRAWHRAAAALGPDAEVADELEAAGLRAQDRGAYTAAASSLERAARLTADTRARSERLFRAAEAAWLAGHAERADERLADAREICEDPALRVEIDHLRGHAALRRGHARAAHDILVAAARDAPPDRAVEMLAEAAEACGFAADPARMLAAARGAWAALTPEADDRARLRATLALGMALIYTGETDRVALGGERAAAGDATAGAGGEHAAAGGETVAARPAAGGEPTAARPAAGGEPTDTHAAGLNGTGGQNLAVVAAGAPWLRTATDLLEGSPDLAGDPTLLASAAIGALWLREAERGRELIGRAIDGARAQGAVGALPFPLWMAGRDAATSDRPHVAVALYEEAIRLARETRQATSLCAGLAGLACVEARQGRDQECREHAGEALALTEELGLAFFHLWALDAMADLELGRGDLEAAIAHLTAKERLLQERDIADPDVSPAPDLAEALRWLDRAHEAEPRLDAFAKAARAKGQPWSLARLARAQGDYDAALRLHARTPDRFETARTLLAQGEALRRERRRVHAREPLRAAIATFDALGAAPWAERARRELQASGETARRRDPLSLDALTPRELQVALVVADGHTIRETAGKLFLSPKTVDHHLQSVYRKLAIDSRAALAVALTQDQEGLPMRAPHAPA